MRVMAAAAATANRMQRDEPDRSTDKRAMTMHNGADKSPLKLPALLDLAAAENFITTMRERLQAGLPLSFDASGVETLTVPCIQIILAARKSSDRLSVSEPSAAFIAAFEDLGLDWSELCQTPPTDAAQQSEVGAPPSGIVQPAEQAEDLAMAKRILTIDDSKTIRDMLMLTLADAGFDVLQAVDGQDGLEVLDKERVDVVITDINMPRMDGYEVIRQMRRNTTHKSTPILVLTTESEKEKKNLAREAGATGWMVKPFDPDRLIATINKVAP
jgi:two-component system, chemotaxis family, chemotaxis protein CheY